MEAEEMVEVGVDFMEAVEIDLLEIDKTEDKVLRTSALKIQGHVSLIIFLLMKTLVTLIKPKPTLPI